MQGPTKRCPRKQVHPNVHFVADVHAYMMEKNEVIGWLGGWFDKRNNVLYVQVLKAVYAKVVATQPFEV